MLAASRVEQTNTNTQRYKYINTKKHKYINTHPQLHKYTSTDTQAEGANASASKQSKPEWSQPAAPGVFMRKQQL